MCTCVPPPPDIPLQLPLTGNSKGQDQRLARRQRTYSAPAHAIAAHLDEVRDAALIPIQQAAALNQDPQVGQLLERALAYLQGKAPLSLGYALRSLASSYNCLASERKENLLRNQSADVKTALSTSKPGFEAFFKGDVAQVLAVAAQTAQLRMTQSALARMGSGNNSFRRSTGNNNSFSSQRRQSNDRPRNNQGRNNSGGQSNSYGQQRKGGDNRRKPYSKPKGNDKKRGPNKKRPPHDRS